MAKAKLNSEKEEQTRENKQEAAAPEKVTEQYKYNFTEVRRPLPGDFATWADASKEWEEQVDRKALAAPPPDWRY